ncbi:hypothetical protein [Chryseobacterium indoltheticum]|uniref:hypothetical protein n=1 Tax=Chryseobacterium indoltheticum TaxID=254 RepID=UPI003F49A74B
MKKILLIIFPLFLSGFLFSQKKTSSKKPKPIPKFNYHEEFKKISDEIFLHGTAYDNLGELTKGVGSHSVEHQVTQKLQNGLKKLKRSGCRKYMETGSKSSDLDKRKRIFANKNIQR